MFSFLQFKSIRCPLNESETRERELQEIKIQKHTPRSLLPRPLVQEIGQYLSQIRARLPLLQIWFTTKYDGIITNCHSLVYYKVQRTVAENFDRFVTKCDTVYYKLRQVLQSAMIIRNYDCECTCILLYYKVLKHISTESSLLTDY